MKTGDTQIKKDSSEDDWKNKDKNDLRTHYEEVGEECRLYDRLIWEIPSLAVTVVGALIVVTYAYINVIYVRIFVLLSAALWLYAIIITTIKHMFFAGIQKKRLMTIEEKGFLIPNLQRFTVSKDQAIETSHWEKASGLQKQRAHAWLKRVLVLTLFLVVFLFLYNVYLFFKESRVLDVVIQLLTECSKKT